MDTHFKRIVIFGRPGSGKSTFAYWLSNKLNLPLHHVDKHYFTFNWVQRNYDEFLDILQNIVNNDTWIIDGNNMKSLEMRISRADLVLYFNFPRIICYYRLLKRFFKPNSHFDDRAPECYETMRLYFLKYVWKFENSASKPIALIEEKYPNVPFREIKNQSDLNKIKSELIRN